jgi:hypothetical protein
VNLRDLWDRVKHGKYSEEELAACERLLENPGVDDLHVAILIVGVARRPNPRLVRIIDAYLRNGKTDAERYTALKILCRYWRLWDEYLPFLYAKVQEDAWESDYALADEAMTLLGDYLFRHEQNKEAWRKLVDVYDAAVNRGDTLVANIVSNAAAVALHGSEKALRAEVAGQPMPQDEVMQAARERARLT